MEIDNVRGEEEERGAGLSERERERERDIHQMYRPVLLSASKYMRTLD